MPETNGYESRIAVTSNNIAAYAHGSDCPAVDRSQRNERSRIMNQMNGWMGGGEWIWPVIGILVVILLGVMIFKMSSRKSGDQEPPAK
jgi:hypothetical protein